MTEWQQSTLIWFWHWLCCVYFLLLLFCEQSIFSIFYCHFMFCLHLASFYLYVTVFLFFELVCILWKCFSEKRKHNAMTISHRKHFKPSNTEHHPNGDYDYCGHTTIIAGTFNNGNIHCSIYFFWLLLLFGSQVSLLSFIIIFGKIILKFSRFSHFACDDIHRSNVRCVPLRLFFLMEPMDLRV